MFLFISVETDGVGAFFNQTLIRLALVLTDSNFDVLALESFFVQGASTLEYNPNGYKLQQIQNGLTPQDAGGFLQSRLDYIKANNGIVIAHNFNFVAAVLLQLQVDLSRAERFHCLMEMGTAVCKLLPMVSGKYKYPQLGELYKHLYPTDTEAVGTKAEEKAWTVKQCYQKLCQSV